jgi:predicted lactoylglutathione lyase
MSSRYFSFVKSKWFLAVGCLILGAAIVLGIRFVAYKSDDVHYHANFALYLDGQREQFKSPQYYTETEMCSADTTNIPTERAHMHDNVNNVVHVEDSAVTWGQFFENLGWTLGPNSITKPDGTLYVASGSQKLHVMLNGQDYTDLSNMATAVIKDEDKMLISFGDESKTTLMQQYRSIPSTAHHYDVTPDPDSCGGHGGSMIHQRFTHML